MLVQVTEISASTPLCSPWRPVVGHPSSGARALSSFHPPGRGRGGARPEGCSCVPPARCALRPSSLRLKIFPSRSLPRHRPSADLVDSSSERPCFSETSTSLVAALPPRVNFFFFFFLVSVSHPPALAEVPVAGPSARRSRRAENSRSENPLVTLPPTDSRCDITAHALVLLSYQFMNRVRRVPVNYRRNAVYSDRIFFYDQIN